MLNGIPLDATSIFSSSWCVRCYGESDGKEKVPATFIHHGESICEKCLKYVAPIDGYWGRWDYTLDHMAIKEEKP